MFKEIFWFEIKQWLKRPAAYIYFMIFFLIALLLGAVIGGLFSGVVRDSNTYMNSAAAIGGIFSNINSNFLFGFISLIVIVSVVATAVFKDFQYNTHALFFTRPVSKFGYLMGRFVANYLVAVFIMSGSIFGYLFACLLIPSDSPWLGPMHLMSFVQPFLLFTVPNTLLIGAIFFSFVTFTRNITAGYIGSLVLIVLLGISRAITADIENKTLAALIEPFGGKALGVLTEYWTPQEKNESLIPLQGVLLANRLLWFGVSLLITALTYYRFRFSQFTSPVALFGKNKKEETSIPSRPVLSIADIPVAEQSFDRKFRWFQFRFLTRFELLKMLKSAFFPVMLLLAVLLTVAVSRVTGAIYGTETYPLTYQMLETIGAQFYLFTLILLVFYSGTLVWREKDSKMDEFVGAAPVRSRVLFGSKFTAVLILIAIMFAANIITCICIQAYSGYTHFELLLYLKGLFGFTFIGFVLTCALAFAVQVFVNNKYVGFFVTVLVLLGLPLLFNAMKWTNPMINFNSEGNLLPYSDMNGYGHTVGKFVVFKMYWAGFTLVLLSFAVAMWQRGKEKNYKARLAAAGANFRKGNRLVVMAGLLLFAGFGSYIYYNIKVLNKYVTPKEAEKARADYEKNYKKYSHTLQPRVVESNLQVDIYPQQLGANIKGYYYLKNKHKTAVDTILMYLDNSNTVKQLDFGAPANRFLDDKDDGFYGYKLSRPLQPGDSLKFTFDISFYEKGFSNDDPGTRVVYNGSFFNSFLLPSFGYSESAELSDNETRKKYGLKPKQRAAPVSDLAARMNNGISRDADWIRFESVLSTDEGQTAIAPGYLIKEWTENGRHYFHYKMDSPILNFYAFLSAKYEVKRDRWSDPQRPDRPVNIEIYYHKGHEYNVDKMINSIKKSLNYYTKNFSPYQHRQVRIIEFPRYATFAQSFPNTIPFSEGIGFIAKINTKDPLSIDYPFYVTAHEVAHQWWAHQVIGGDVQGGAVMVETMSQYSALMVMEKEFGKPAMKKFLKYEMDKYLQARQQENKKEMPLMLEEGQPYLYYNKGSVVMYALKDYLGEDSLNSALRRYIKKVAFQEPPYTNSIEFVNEIRRSTPDSLQYVVTDLFEKITLFENNIKTLAYTKEANGKYKVKLVVEAKKFQADSVGRQKEVKISDWIDIGVFKETGSDDKKEEKELFMKKMKITSSPQTIEMMVDEEPTSAGIDPYNKLIDRNPDNNRRSFKGGDQPAGGKGGNVTISIGKKSED